MTNEELADLITIRQVLSLHLAGMAKMVMSNPNRLTNDQFGLIGLIDQVDEMIDKWTKRLTQKPDT